MDWCGSRVPCPRRSRAQKRGSRHSAGVYLVMEHAAWLTLVPLAFATLATGLVMSLGTSWGLFRHYWVVFKLVITVFATADLHADIQADGCCRCRYWHGPGVGPQSVASGALGTRPGRLGHSNRARHLQASGPYALRASQATSTGSAYSNMSDPDTPTPAWVKVFGIMTIRRDCCVRDPAPCRRWTSQPLRDRQSFVG